MSQITRLSAAPLPPSRAEAVPPDASPPERLALDAEAAGAAAKEAGRRVAEVRAALSHAESHPLEFPEASYHKAVDELRHALARACDTANRANAERERAREALEAAKSESLKASEAPASEAHDAALEALSGAVLGAAASLSEPLALAVKTREARDSVRAELRAAGEPVGKDARTSMASALPSLLDPRPGAVGALATALNVAVWLEAVPQREAEEREFQRSKEVERKRAALLGAYGPGARAAAEEEARAEFRAAHAARSYTGMLARGE